jgi:small neutral amino acid transporter SnatA (MarC family)
MDTLSATLVLFLVMDPLGNVPLFLSLMKDLAPERRRWVLVRELLIALAALFLFLLAGKPMLDVLKLDLEAVSITGGIVLFLIGLRMIFPPKDGVFGEQIGGEPFIVPMAVPGIAGPSTMAILLLMGHEHPDRTVDWSIALTLAWAATAIVLFASTALYRWLGASVLAAIEKLMGMVLIAMSVQMLLDGLAGFLARVAN